MFKFNLQFKKGRIQLTSKKWRPLVLSREARNWRPATWKQKVWGGGHTGLSSRNLSKHWYCKV